MKGMVRQWCWRNDLGMHGTPARAILYVQPAAAANPSEETAIGPQLWRRHSGGLPYCESVTEADWYEDVGKAAVNICATY